MIELHGLQKVIEQRTVIDIAHFMVRPGEIMALLGSAGSGKGDLMDLLTGRTRPTAGTVRVGGCDPSQEKRCFSQQVGVLYAEDGLYPQQTARANLLFYCRLHGVPRARADEVLAKVGLADHAGMRVGKLSSGLARRLAFGRAILHGPQTLILMEPFARCDEASISLIGGLMVEMAEEEAALLVMAEDSVHLRAFCHRFHILQQGRITEAHHPTAEQEQALPFKIPARLEGSVALVNPGEILYADAEEGRAYIMTAEGRLPTQFTLSELEARLSRSGFFRAHRGYLVNLQHVKEVIPFTRNSYSLRLDDEDGTLIPLSKSAAAELRELLGY
jgi:ABC-2 type transport system ATP-binding protein